MQCRSNFNVAGTWGGLTDEGVEIGGKKISSEEETFSDLSMLILYNNFLVRLSHDDLQYRAFRGITESCSSICRCSNPVMPADVKMLILTILEN